ncbi:MAG: cation transporting ATPase C-terminal domain-containing protein, partial [Betaproteobacteria bacterium]|nr:cation transporting ATPase C-terminal domain-containing protein [Betaproteobacteria bacterium]
LTLTQLAHVLAIRAQRESLWGRAWRDNPALLGAVALTVLLQLAVIYWGPLQRLFHTRALSALELGACGACALLVAGVVELEKAWRRRREAAARAPDQPPK